MNYRSYEDYIRDVRSGQMPEYMPEEQMNYNSIRRIRKHVPRRIQSNATDGAQSM